MRKPCRCGGPCGCVVSPLVSSHPAASSPPPRTRRTRLAVAAVGGVIVAGSDAGLRHDRHRRLASSPCSAAASIASTTTATRSRPPPSPRPTPPTSSPVRCSGSSTMASPGRRHGHGAPGRVGGDGGPGGQVDAGIWAGMSGSPGYDDEGLLSARWRTDSPSPRVTWPAPRRLPRCTTCLTEAAGPGCRFGRRPAALPPSAASGRGSAFRRRAVHQAAVIWDIHGDVRKVVPTRSRRSP